MKLYENEYILDQSHIEFYKENNFIKLKQVLDKDTINYYNDIITKCVAKLNKNKEDLSKRDTYGKAFIQLANLWQLDDLVKSLVFNKRIAKIASDLMQVDGVRLYHDQALFKEPGGGITPWHADQFYWPLTSDKTITAWIPLQDTPLEMGPLEFSAKSQNIKKGRDLAISDESEIKIDKHLKITDFKHVIEPFEIGEISFHSGWVFHRAGANHTDHTRKVMTIIYMDKDMILKEPKNKNEQLDRDTWCPNSKIGEIIDSPLNPILYQNKNDR